MCAKGGGLKGFGVPHSSGIASACRKTNLNTHSMLETACLLCAVLPKFCKGREKKGVGKVCLFQ